MLASMITSLGDDPLGVTNHELVRIAAQSVYGTTLQDRLLSASTSTYTFSRILRITSSTIALKVNELILQAETDPLSIIFGSPIKIFIERMKEYAINSDESLGRFHRMLTTHISPEYHEPMTAEMATSLIGELKAHFLDHLQLRINCALLISKSFKEALEATMTAFGQIAATALNKWVHGVIQAAVGIDLGPVQHDIFTGDGAVLLFGATYEYNSNEREFNRMSATLMHYLTQHLHTESDVIRGWSTLWTPTALQTSIGMEATSPVRPWATPMKYMLSYDDRTNIGNILVVSELTYVMHSEYKQILTGTDRTAAAQLMIHLLRTLAFLYTVRITRDIQENQASPLYGYAVYPFTVKHIQAYDGWPSVCARVRKSLRDRETVEMLLGQMRGAIAAGSVSEIEVPNGSCDTLMAEDWVNGELAVALNGDRRPEVLVRTADYERMLLLGTAENPFDRRDVKTLEVIRIRLI
jgi:hypothetical protein